MAKHQFGQRLKQIFGHVLPTLGAAVGGPFGAMAGKMAQQALGVDSEEAALDALENDPEAFVKLKQAELALEQRLEELGLKREELAVQDRSSARQLAQQTTIWPQVGLSVLYTAAYVSMLWAFLAGVVHVDPQYEGLVQTLIGALSAAQLQILNFWFGSSSGSKEKTAVLARNGHAAPA